MILYSIFLFDPFRISISKVDNNIDIEHRNKLNMNQRKNVIAALYLCDQIYSAGQVEFVHSSHISL